MSARTNIEEKSQYRRRHCRYAAGPGVAIMGKLRALVMRTHEKQQTADGGTSKVQRHHTLIYNIYPDFGLLYRRGRGGAILKLYRVLISTLWGR